MNKQYTTANSRFIGNQMNGIVVVSVLRQRGTSNYIAVVREDGNINSEPRVVSYDHVVQASAGNVNLRAKYHVAPSTVQYGLAKSTKALEPSTGASLVTSIARESTNAGKVEAQKATTVNQPTMTVSEVLATMQRITEAAKNNADIRGIVKLVANSL
jgi:hypothetical protein